jgi:uncharacterized protein YuzE
MSRLDITIDIGPFCFTDFSYDAENDVAYLSIGEPREAVTWESPEGHLLRLDPDTDQLVGVTFLHLKERMGTGDLTITFPEWAIPASRSAPASTRTPVRVPPRILSRCCL